MPTYHVYRSIEIDASPDDVFEVVADFSKWKEWSPWLCAEPDAEVTVTGDPSSLEAQYSWSGEVVGAGEMEHKKLERGRLIENELRFLKPFKSTCEVWFDLEPAGSGTKITWHMRGSLPWFLFWMTSMMEVYIGMDYERGLKMLKEWIETGEILSRTINNGVVSVGPIRMAGIRKTCTLKDIGPQMQSALCQAAETISQHGISTDAGVMTVYHTANLKTGIFDFTSGIILPDSAEPPSELSTWSIPTMKALCLEHHGNYEHLGNAWSSAHQIARYRKYKQAKVGTFEIYRNDPEQTPPAEIHTDVYMPLRKV